MRKCNTSKKYCNVRTKDGLCKLDAECRPVVEQCKNYEDKSCDRIDSGFCSAYINPEVKWKVTKTCPLATHIITRVETKKGKIRVGQQKQKKIR